MDQTHFLESLPGHATDYHGKAVCRVTYRMTDQMGVVYYGNYLELMEMGRGALMRACGLDYREMEAEGWLFPAAHVSVDYLSPARYDDLLVITAHVESWNRVRMDVAYEIHRAGETAPLARGRSRHVFIGRDGRPRRLDAKWTELMRALADRFGLPADATVAAAAGARVRRDGSAKAVAAPRAASASRSISNGTVEGTGEDGA